MSTRFLKRHILASDDHSFVGRIHDLSIVSLHFDNYEELSKHADCKYAFHVNWVLSALTSRVESLNLVGSMLWPELLPENFRQFPLSRYEWLTVCADVFLARYISVADCALILVNDVFECDLAPKACSADKLRKGGVPSSVLDVVAAMVVDQGGLRKERNARFHHGSERGFSSDNKMFRIGSLFEDRLQGARGANGRALPVGRLFREGLVELQREFNRSTKLLEKQLDRLSDLLYPEFQRRFSPKFALSEFSGRSAVK